MSLETIGKSPNQKFKIGQTFLSPIWDASGRWSPLPRGESLLFG